ncbi:MAG: prolyl oligopeptidase family serine peptidase [Chloroflexota bacterium]
MTSPQPENAAPHSPSLRQLLMLPVPDAVRISPDGDKVAAIVRRANWNENCYETLCQVYRVDTGAVHWLTRAGRVSQVEWLDNDTLALLKTGTGKDDKAQVWLYEGLSGDGWQVTQHKTGVEWFKPFAGGFLFRAKDPEREEKKERADQFGKFTHFEQEDSASALYYTGLAEVRAYQAQVKAVTEDEAKKLVQPVVELSRLLETPLFIWNIVPAPGGDAIYLNCWKRDDMVYFRDRQVFCIQLDPQAALDGYVLREQARQKAESQAADAPASQASAPAKEDLSYLGRIIRLNLPGTARVGAVSPDGRKLLLHHQGRDEKMYTRDDIWLLDAQVALQASDAAACLDHMHNLSASLDRDVMEVYWTQGGIFGDYVDGTCVRIARFDEGEGGAPLDLGGVFTFAGFHVGASGQLALVGATAETFPEVYLAEPSGGGAPWQVRQLSDFGQALQGWQLGQVETIRWRSRDGVEVEGVLRKPANFDPSRRYPLVMIVHGGPLWFEPAYLCSYDDLYYYPAVQFANRDILVLKPNYRGSLGRGQAFAELNVENLGIGDLWDLESAIDHLVELGWVDPQRVGCMGWSQGGYISAFAGLHSDRFRAVSVGAGVSDWYTYHISNDIPDFTVDYLSASPFDKRDLYFKTAPISSLANAKTPMLIQHGAEDRRVPFSNAMELYRGLKAVGVPVELFVFPGMGHPITKPRENHAVMHQNLAWFSHYLLGEALNLLEDKPD